MIFESVRRVLTDLDEAGSDEWGDWDDRVLQRIEALAASYTQLRDRNRPLIDYSDLATHAAYVFMYVAGHAEFIYQILREMRATQPTEPIFDSEEIRVTSMGGGPGSELLGLLKYLSTHADEPVDKIIYTVTDKEPNWEHVVESLTAASESEVDVVSSFHELDVSDLPACQAVDWSEEDLVFMNFFISEVCATQGGASVRASLNHLLGTVRTGGIVIYNDSNAYSFYRFFNERVWAADRYFQALEIEREFTVASPDLSGILEEYIDRHGRTPKLNSNAVAKVMVRAET